MEILAIKFYRNEGGLMVALVLLIE